ncbi:putative pterin-4-alpha-carbinolamine dehydratase [Acrocarpospora phusangensis]|uniref:Putative pterin-4-alpha-carbinolamine dehydratase n=1 Tax=Acrocarpospora phusangensis TaxID=1070424 RepID=A0A919Q7L2_9ACTN|nr:4a-hydroxytetrahydrobiopterin dehydratase [Acrocarpospora phusangensis]GIH23924.1 putative pterin-4-alpha-carbinolamine dehydratase [Acrocarpospora phusangensis]
MTTPRVRLSEAEITAALAELPEWAREGDAVVRTVAHPDFGAALGWVVRVGLIAEKVDHHPDIDVRYNQVTLRLWTHTTGSITAADIDLAKRIDATV